MPPWARVWLGSLLLLGILSIHSAIVSDEGGFVDHHGSVSVLETSMVSGIDPGASNGESGLSMSDCGGIAMLCLAMIVGVSAYIVLRNRSLDRVLGQITPILGTAFGRPSGPFEALSPRERSSVLRR